MKINVFVFLADSTPMAHVQIKTSAVAETSNNRKRALREIRTIIVGQGQEEKVKSWHYIAIKPFKKRHVPLTRTIICSCMRQKCLKHERPFDLKVNCFLWKLTETVKLWRVRPRLTNRENYVISWILTSDHLRDLIKSPKLDYLKFWVNSVVNSQ